MRAPLLWLALGAGVAGCCFGGAGSVVPPIPPIPQPPTTPPPTTFGADCMGLCQRTAACMVERGQPIGADESNCAVSCAPGGPYASMPPASLACVSAASCEAFDECNGQAIAQMLMGILGGAPPPGAAGPPGWPDGFPVVPGGTPVPAPAAGPVHVSILSYAGSSPDDLDARYHAALIVGGWTAPLSESGPEAHRFQATRGASSVSVSIYQDGAQTIIQTMQF